MKKISQILLVTMILACVGRAQVIEDEVVPPPKRADIAVAEIMLINVAVWGYAYYALDGFWSQISWQTADMNLRHGFEWDPNKFKTNFFDHPFHGNLYFNSARTNGMSFWESAPFAFGGSMMWELFMESEFPSYNDLVMTTVGGIAVGEVMFRFSEQILDDRARGANRVFREIGATVVNPIGGLNRLIRGDMFIHRSSKNHIRNPLHGLVAIGGSGNWGGSAIGDTDIKPALNLTMHYGQPLEIREKRKPFDYFTFRFWTSEGDTSRNMAIMSRGLLAGKNFQSGKNDQVNHLAGLMLHYDYINNSLVNFGSATLAGAWMARFPLGKNFRLVTAPNLGAIIMGGSNNEYASSSHGLNYNYSTGFKARMDLLLVHPKFGSLYADYSYFNFRAIQGVLGRDRVDVASIQYNLPLYNNFGLGAEYIYYFRKARYDDFPDTENDFNGLRMILSYAY